MIEFQDVNKGFGGQIILKKAVFRIHSGERVGVVGPNGAGKSTVFELIDGQMTPDSGRVIVRAGLRLGHVRQQINPQDVRVSLVDYVENAVAEVQDLQHAIDRLHAQFDAGEVEHRDRALRELGQLQTRFEAMGGYDLRRRAETALSGLGFNKEDFGRPLDELSGGWQMRAELARVIVSAAELLLLDEPSNYLDIPAIEWLQRYLREFRGTLMLISHDRFLLNSLTTTTIEIADSRAERYPGNYDFYARERALRYEQRLAAQKNQDRKREQLERFIERFRAKSSLATQAQSRIKQLARMEKIERLPRVATRGRIRLRPPPHCGAEVVRLEQAGLTYDDTRWVLRGLDIHINRGDKIALVGYNGLGKTTLLRMLAGRLPPSEGKRILGHKVLIGYQSQDFAETMDPLSTVLGTVKSVAADVSEQDARTMLGGFGFSGDTVEKPVEVLSGGEKIRLAFARLLIKPPNFLVLDEPTTHLDIQSREALEQALRDYEGTLCLVSHDIDFVRHVATGIIAMTPPDDTAVVGEMIATDPLGRRAILAPGEGGKVLVSGFAG